MGSYIFLIRPDDESVNELDSGYVKWKLPVTITQSTQIKEKDTVYICFGQYRTNISNNISLQNRIAYTCTIKDVVIINNALTKKHYIEAYMKVREIAFDKSELLTFGKDCKKDENLNKIAYNFNVLAMQAYMIDLQKSVDPDYTELKKYIEKVLLPLDAYIDKLDDRRALYQQLKKYDKIFKDKYVNTGAAKVRRVNKLSGNIATYLVKQYIEKLIGNQPIKISEPNCYILGTNAEFDLVVLKKGATPLKEMNIYCPNDVKCVIEVKKSGMFGSIKKKNSKNKSLKEETEYIKQSYNSAKKLNADIKFAYITLQETNSINESNDNYLGLTEKYFDNRVFCFKPKYEYKSNPKYYKPFYTKWEKFVIDCIF